MSLLAGFGERSPLEVVEGGVRFLLKILFLRQEAAYTRRFGLGKCAVFVRWAFTPTWSGHPGPVCGLSAGIDEDSRCRSRFYLGTPDGLAECGFCTPDGFAERAVFVRWAFTPTSSGHPALASVRITHRWGGPILFTEKMLPIFRWLAPQGFTTKGHPRSKRVMVLAGYNGHGVALSVYLGKWAAQALLARRPLPRWH